MKKSVLSLGILGLLMASAFTVYADIPGRNPNISDTAWQNYGVATKTDIAANTEKLKKYIKEGKTTVPVDKIDAYANNQTVFEKASTSIVNYQTISAKNAQVDYRVMLPGSLVIYDEYNLRFPEEASKYSDLSYVQVGTTQGLFILESDSLARRLDIDKFLNTPYEQLTDEQIRNSFYRENKKVNNIKAGKLIKNLANVAYPTWDYSVDKQTETIVDKNKQKRKELVETDNTTGNMYWRFDNKVYYTIGAKVSSFGKVTNKDKEKSRVNDDDWGTKALANYVLPSFRPASTTMSKTVSDVFMPTTDAFVSDIESVKYYKPLEFKDIPTYLKKSARRIDQVSLLPNHKASLIVTDIHEKVANNTNNYMAHVSSIIRTFAEHNIKLNRVEYLVSNNVPGIYLEANYNNNEHYISYFFPAGASDTIYITYESQQPLSDKDVQEIREIIQTATITLKAGIQINSQSPIVNTIKTKRV